MGKMAISLLVMYGLMLGDPSGAHAGGKLAQLQEFSDGLAELAAQVKPGVVAIKTEKVVQYASMGDPLRGTPFEDFFGGHPFFRMPRQPKEQRQEGLGSGVIISKEGYILTNNHVITGQDRETEADRITVQLVDKRSFEAEVVGRDPMSDLAVLKVDADNLPVVPYGDSDGMRVGDLVVAVGNPFGQLHTVTLGMVSAVGRGYVGLAEYEDYIQTDAAINPGNSGGALVNMHGELVGINTAIVSRSGGYQGIGFAIPVNMARNIMDQLVEHGEVQRGLLGVNIQEVTQDVAQALGMKKPRGVLIGDVNKGSAADKAGIERGDIVLSVDGALINDVGELRNRIAMSRPGSKVRLQILRDGSEKSIAVTLDHRDDQQVAAAASDVGSQLGMHVQTLTKELAAQLGYNGEKGVVISSVQSGSLAAHAGLRQGDLIQEINRKTIGSVDEYQAVLEQAAKRGTALLLVRREQNTQYVALRLG